MGVVWGLIFLTEFLGGVSFARLVGDDAGNLAPAAGPATSSASVLDATYSLASVLDATTSPADGVVDTAAHLRALIALEGQLAELDAYSYDFSPAPSGAPSPVPTAPRSM